MRARVRSPLASRDRFHAGRRLDARAAPLCSRGGGACPRSETREESARAEALSVLLELQRQIVLLLRLNHLIEEDSDEDVEEDEGVDEHE